MCRNKKELVSHVQYAVKVYLWQYLKHLEQPLGASLHTTNHAAPE